MTGSFVLLGLGSREMEIKTFTPSVRPSITPVDVAAALGESTTPLAVIAPLVTTLPITESTLSRQRRLQLPSAAAALVRRSCCLFFFSTHH